MPFAYYARLTRAQQRVYRRSDEIGAITLRGGAALCPLVHGLSRALEAGDRGETERAAQAVLDGLAGALRVRRVRAEVLAVRPSRDWGELHGLYTPSRREGRDRITLWMRTAQRRQVVAFRTFLRTLLHELCHHLDYELLGLPESFHTEGFYRRESSLLHQLLGSAGTASLTARPAQRGPLAENP